MKTPMSPLFTWRAAIGQSDLKSTARLVAVMLSCHMSEAGDSCFPGFDRLAKECGLSRRATIEAIKALEAAEYLIVHRAESPGRGQAYTNRYEAAIPKRVQEMHSLQKRVQEVPKKGARGAPESVIESVTPITDVIGAAEVQSTNGEAKTNGQATAPIGAIVEFYVDECQARGYTPPRHWRAALGNQAKRLSGDKPVDLIRSAARVIAAERKQPGVLAHVLVDIEAGRSGKGGSS